MDQDVTVKFGADADDFLDALNQMEAAQNDSVKGFNDQTKAAENTSIAINKMENSLRSSLETQNRSGEHDPYIAKYQDMLSDKAQEWQSLFSPIDKAFSRSIKGIIQGSLTLSQAGKRAAQSLALSFVEAAEKSATAWIAGQLAMVETQRVMEAEKTAAAKAGSTARETIGAAENNNCLGHVGAQISSWLGLERTKTAATSAGAATRTAVETTAAAEKRTVDAATAKSSIVSKAADAAAGAFDAMADIPIIGPVLGAAAAAATFAAVMAFQSIASAEGGWDRVPFDGALTELHKNEMVLPAWLAEPIRDMATGSATAMGAPGQGASGQAAGGGSGDVAYHIAPAFHISAHDGDSVRRMLLDNHGAVAEALARAVRSGNRHVARLRVQGA